MPDTAETGMPRNNRRWIVGGLAMVAVVLLGVVALIAKSGNVDVPFTEVKDAWSVGIAMGASPLEPVLAENNPILSKTNVPGADVLGVADPFLLIDGDKWYMYVEVIESNTDYPHGEKGVIGVASSVDDGATWTYERVVVEEDWHLSYPLVFAHDGSWWMVPEASGSERVTLYRADDPIGPWVADTVIIEGVFTDPTVFPHDDRWWMLGTSTTDDPDDTLHLFHADSLTGPWSEHPSSPVVLSDNSRARPAGPVVSNGGALYRFAQDGSEGYGRAVRVFRIETLTRTSYAEEEAINGPLLRGSGEGWNELGMHHIAWVQLDDGTWVAAVDGFTSSRVFGLNVG